MKYIKYILFLICLILVTLGCSNESKTSSQSEVELTPVGTFPIVEEEITMGVMIGGKSLVEDFETNEFTKWYEEKTNIKIKFEVVPQANIQERLNLALSSGDYPDVMIDMGVSPTQQMIYGSQGVFIPLNDLIEEHGYYSKEMFEELPHIKEVITAPDGNIYALPQVNECYHCSYSQKLWIYEPWLDELGLDMPETTDDFYKVLKAFKEEDPNGNGKADEIPLAGANEGAYVKIDQFLMNAFIYNNYFNNARHMYLDDGKIDVAFNKPEWKEGLEYLNMLYEEGLIAPETFTQDDTQFKQMGENPDIPILGAAQAMHNGVATQFYGESGRWLEFTAVPPLKGPNGVQVAPHNPYGISTGTFLITDKAKHPEAAFRWADGFMETETTLRSVIGRPDKEWKWAEDGQKGIDGSQAVWERLVEHGQVQNIHWEQSGPSLRTNEFRFSEVASDDQPLEPLLYEETKKYQ